MKSLDAHQETTITMRSLGIWLVCLVCLLGLVAAGGCQRSATDNCPEKAGYVLCGQCDGTTVGHYSGQCRYCASPGYCCGDLCAEWGGSGLNCFNGNKAGSTTNGSPGPGGGPGAVCGGSIGGGNNADMSSQATMGTLTATIGGNMLCPIGFSGQPGACASGGAIYVGRSGNCGSTLACAGGGGALSIDFVPIPSPGSSSPCTALGITQGQQQSACNQMGGQISGMITVMGTTGNLTVSGTCACGGSPGAQVTFDNLPLTVM
jgi:hypothetical protein